MNDFERGKEPELSLLDRPPQRANVILPGEGLLGVGRGIVNGEARIQAGGALVKRSPAVPGIGSALGDNHHGAGCGAPGVRVLLRRAHSKFLNGVRREILQEPADVVIGIVRAIHRKLHVQTGTAAEADGGDARLGGVGGLHRFGSGNEISDVGKGAMGERNVRQVLGGDGALVHRSGEIDGLGGDGRGLALDVQLLGEGFKAQGDGDPLRLETLAQKLDVKGQASSITTQAINLTGTVHQGAVSAQDLTDIPLAHRTFANIAYLVPGTEPVEPSDPTKARITAVSFGGSSGLNVQLSVDGADNSDDYIGGFLQNFSPDTIQEFAVRTAQEDADTGRTTAGSVVIVTKRGTDAWHGGGAFYERAASLNARFPIDNPPPNPKQPFSRQNYIGTLGGPIEKGKFWFFSSLEVVHEDASIAYSPASSTQFDALATLASQGLIPGVTSIPVPPNVPVPFRDYLGTTRFDWNQSTRSQWFLRASTDNYHTDNDLVQQATLPSTGATSVSRYWSFALGNQFTFSPTWLGSLTLDAGLLHHTEARNSNLGFALAFPFSSTSSSISGFETFGDNQFVTPITAFPVLRDQEKYQFRYDVSHVSGRHAPRFGVDLIHEPVMSGALSGTAENLTVFPLDPVNYLGDPQQFSGGS